MQRTEDTANKDKIRQQALKRRRALLPHHVAMSSRAITERVLALPMYTQARCLHIYVSGKDNEVDTLPLIEHSLRAGKEVAVPLIGRHDTIPQPHTRVKTHAMAHAQIHHINELDDAYWGIRQPSLHTARWMSSWDCIDLVIVPGIRFDPQGNRIGYGAGYYDRFLAQLRARRVGLCCDALIGAAIPSQDHDIRMDLVISETTTYKGEPR